MSLVEEADVETGPDICLLLQVGDDVDTLYSLPEHRKVEVLVFKIDIEAVGEVRCRVVNPVLVSLRDDVVAIEVLPAHTSQCRTVLSCVIVYFVLALEDAVGDIPYLRSHRMTDNALHAVAAECTVGSDRCREGRNLVAVGADVARNVIMESAGGRLPVACIELNATVFHLAGINPLRAAFAHRRDTRHLHENVPGLLVIPVEAAIEGGVEQGEVQTEVGLRGRLPLDVVVSELIALEAAGKLASAVRSGNVVGSPVALSAVLVHAVIADVDGVTGDI